MSWFSSIPDSGFSLLAPGQVHAVATLSRATEEMTPGAIMYGSQFLAAQCMLSSLLSSWTDRISQVGALQEFAWSRTITTCLVAMVGAVGTVSQGQPQIHDATPVDIISLASMAMLFIQQERDPEAYDAAKWLRDTYAVTHPHYFQYVQRRFRELKMANLQMDSSSGEVPHLRRRMWEAAKNMLGTDFRLLSLSP